MIRQTFLIPLLVIGCSSGKPVTQTELLSSWGEQVILPTYELFGDETQTLVTTIESLCESLDGESLAAARVAWASARSPWKQMEVFAFGPYDDAPLRLGPKIDFWPARENSIESILGDSSPIDPEALGAPTKGLPAIEYLLFRENALASLSESPRACEYLTLLSTDLQENANAIRSAWEPAEGNYLAELVEASGGVFDDTHAALSEVVNRMAFTVENIRSDKLGVSPDKIESRFSDRSIEDIRDNLTGLENLYFNDGVTLSSYAKDRGHDFDDLMRESVATVRLALDRIPEPLSTAIVDNPESIESALVALTSLQRLIQVDIIGALALAPAFNDNDGD